MTHFPTAKFHAWAIGPRGASVDESGRAGVAIGLRHEDCPGHLDIKAFLAATGKPWITIRLLFLSSPPLELYQGPLDEPDFALPVPFRQTSQTCSRCQRPLRECELDAGICNPCRR